MWWWKIYSWYVNPLYSSLWKPAHSEVQGKIPKFDKTKNNNDEPFKITWMNIEDTILLWIHRWTMWLMDGCGYDYFYTYKVVFLKPWLLVADTNYDY
jgi:hypothetical protein